jgi:hypothetical protein
MENLARRSTSYVLRELHKYPEVSGKKSELQKNHFFSEKYPADEVIKYRELSPFIMAKTRENNLV